MHIDRRRESQRRLRSSVINTALVRYIDFMDTVILAGRNFVTRRTTLEQLRPRRASTRDDQGQKNS